MKRTPIIIDCDPGTDDAVALLMMMAARDQLNVLGITTVFGNVPLPHITRNALQICELACCEDIPVYEGCSHPMVNIHSCTFEEIHGKTGIDGADLPPPRLKKQEKHAIDFIIETLLSSPEKITLACTAPMTNLAIALVKEPRIKEKIEKVVFMGGSVNLGNITPCAEFNIFCDPHAAHVVFKSGVKMVMAGLDVTHQLILSPQRKQRLKEINNKASKMIIGMYDLSEKFDMKRYDFDGGVIHDGAVIAYLLKPDLFSGRDCPGDVEIHSTVAIGRTIIDWWNMDKKPANIHVLEKVDTEAFFEHLFSLIASYR